MKCLFENEFEEIFEKGVVPEGKSISWLMSQLDLHDTAQKIEREYYSPKLQRFFHYSVEFMIKLLVVMVYRKISPRQVHSKVTEEDLSYLLPANASHGLPSRSTIHHFVKYRLGVEGMEYLMLSVGKKISRYLKEENLIVDSTPLLASRYSANSLFNPHYRVKMDKAHIMSLGNYPLYMIHSEGTRNDQIFGKALIDVAQLMELQPKYVLMDAGYDSWEMHTRIFEKLQAHPIIQLRKNAIIHKEASEEGIQNWMNKFWKRDGANYCNTIEEKLRFLCGTEKRELVGLYLRNQNIEDNAKFTEIYKNRSACERKHAHIKSIVKFDVTGYRNEGRELYSLLHFIAFQIMNLANLQNHFQNATSLAGYR